MFRILACALACAIALAANAAPLPLTVKDISLMLRAGYSSQMVFDELTQRRFNDTLDNFKEKQLIYAGASPELLLALRTGVYTLSTEEAAQLKKQVEKQKEIDAKHRAVAAQEARQFDTLHQAQVTKDRVTEEIRRQIDDHAVYHQLKGDLVQYRNGSVSRFDDAELEGKRLFLIYFSAHWYQPCRLFTPTLVTYYNDAVAKHPELDLIFVSRDKSAFGMETFMRENNMPWPALEYEKISLKPGIQKYAGKELPALVLVDGSGKVLADSYEGEKYVGPFKVLDALSTILKKGSGAEVARAP